MEKVLLERLIQEAYTPNQWFLLQDLLHKKQTRSRNEPYHAFEYGKEYMRHYLKLITSLAMKAYYVVFGNTNMTGICLFSFGSPSRFEMLGESDLDLLIVKENHTTNLEEFQRIFIDYLKPYKFCKLDIPVWGTIDECEDYLKNAVTEANQVLEARYVLGDLALKKRIDLLKQKYFSQEKFEKIIVFQYLYFNQYYKQRGRSGQTNLKYGHGGTRDFLFPVWFSNLHEGVNALQSEEPAILRAITSLKRRKEITFTDFKKFRRAANFVAFLRNHLLMLNKYDEDFGKTFINEITLKKIYDNNKNLFESQGELLNLVRVHTKEVFELKELIWTLLLKHFEISKSVGWNSNLKRILNANLDEDLLRSLEPSDEILNTLAVWNLKKDDVIFRRYLSSLAQAKSWIILTSIACHPDCPAEILDSITRNQAGQKGYEYILKVVGRNRNTEINTLKFIVENPAIEPSFKEPSVTRLKYGLERANQL